MVAATGFHPWLHTLFESTILLPSLLASSGPGPPFDPVHDSSEEGATQPEYLRVRETSERSKKKKRNKKNEEHVAKRERDREREHEIVQWNDFSFISSR